MTRGSTSVAEVVAAVASAPPPQLIALDVDGTLAPLVPRADQAALLPGAAQAIATLAEEGVAVAVVSGRGLDNLRRQFPWPEGLRLIASDGVEDSTMPPVGLSAEERQRLHAVRTLAEKASAKVPGTWVETKAASVAFHYREARSASIGSVAAQRLGEHLNRIDGVWLRRGHLVLEASVRELSKGEALGRIRGELGVASVVYVGDDETDEEAFATLGPEDVTVRVGPGETVARHRVADPATVVELLGALAGAGVTNPPG